MTGNKKSFSAILSVIIICSLSSFTRAEDIDYKIIEPNEVPNVLLKLASATQANFNKIKTWQGNVINETVFTIRGEKVREYLSESSEAEPNESINEIQRLYKKEIEFKIDVENNRFFSFSDRSTEPYTYIDTDKGKSYAANRGPEEQLFLVTSEHEIEITPLSWRGKDNAVTSRIAMKRPPGATDLTDPRDVFRIGYKTLWLTLSQLAQHLQMPNIEKLGIVIKEKSAGGHKTYRIEISDPGVVHPSQIFVLGDEVGFNRTYIENWYDKDSLMSKTTTEFVNLQGVFLPKKWEFSQYYRDGGLMRQEFNTIETQQINVPIPDSTFSELTYLSSGDRLRDRITNKDFECKNGKLVELVKKLSEK
jgi:hypothetical protein